MPINKVYFSQVDESWYPMKHQVEIFEVLSWVLTAFLIWDQTIAFKWQIVTYNTLSYNYFI